MSNATATADLSYLHELQRRATEARLFDQRYWHLLLHYRKNFWGGYTSEVDDPGFFMAQSGATDPKAELLATLRQFFSPTPVGRSKQPAQCAFIARFAWLREQLSFDGKRLSVRDCPRFSSWIAELNPQKISLIFPAAFMNNPASMFGHTFLRVDQKGQTEQTRILSYTINYSADVPQDAGAEYAWNGIFGGYKGYFSTIPYYMKVKEYRDLENRDIWEYDLSFNKGQIHNLLMHAWELGNAYFDYYFFKENCAYHILSLLEIADPTLQLTDQYVFWTVPADTIRALFEYEGLVENITYRPARSTKIKRIRETLNEDEMNWLHDINVQPAMADSKAFTSLSPQRQAVILDLVSDYLRFKALTYRRQAEGYQSLNRSVLVKRSKLKIRSNTPDIIPFTTAPETGHKTTRIGLGVGWREDSIFEELTLRAVYHDLLDPDTGYTRDAQIELGALRLRHYEKGHRFRVERFTFANVVSLSPIDGLFRNPSWKLNIGMETIRFKSCRLCSSGNVNVGIGGAIESNYTQREVYFAFAEGDANVSGAFDANHRVGVGGTSGIVANLTSSWKALFTVGYFYYPLGDRSDDLRVSVGQRYTLSQHWALRAEFSHRDQDNQAVLSVQTYF